MNKILIDECDYEKYLELVELHTPKECKKDIIFKWHWRIVRDFIKAKPGIYIPG